MVNGKHYRKLGDGKLDYEVRPGYLPTASPSEQSTMSGERLVLSKNIFLFEKKLINNVIHSKCDCSFKDKFIPE